MKNKSALTITLYAFTVLSLLYTMYTLFSTYAQLSSYYASYDVGAGVIGLTLLTSCFTPMALTVIIYGLASVSDLMYQILNLKKAELKTEEIQTGETKEAEGNE